MKHKRLPPDDPREWIRRAKSNLTIAGSDIPGVDFADLCFDAQQAA
jgi:HEPN domain-containing protein